MFIINMNCSEYELFLDGEKINSNSNCLYTNVSKGIHQIEVYECKNNFGPLFFLKNFIQCVSNIITQGSTFNELITDYVYTTYVILRFYVYDNATVNILENGNINLINATKIEYRKTSIKNKKNILISTFFLCCPILLLLTPFSFFMFRISIKLILKSLILQAIVIFICAVVILIISMYSIHFIWRKINRKDNIGNNSGDGPKPLKKHE